MTTEEIASIKEIEFLDDPGLEEAQPVLNKYRECLKSIAKNNPLWEIVLKRMAECHAIYSRPRYIEKSI